LEISEEFVAKAADAMQVWINPALSIARDIALGRNLKLFLKVAAFVYDSMTSSSSSFFSFLFFFFFFPNFFSGF